MKIVFLAPVSNYHTIKWCKYFIVRGYEVYVLSFVNGIIEGANVHCISSGASFDSNDVEKLKYLFCAKKVRRMVEKIEPNIVSVHYATSYGTVAALAGLKNYTLSVWGSDIYEFPQKSILHRALLKFSLNSASLLLSTSQAMANEAHRYTNKEFIITPFGVDIDLFSPNKRTRKGGDGLFVVGTIKALSPKYGISYLLEAASIINRERPDIQLQLRIAGTGPEEANYRNQAKDLGINCITHWLGFIPQEEVAVEWANMDVAIIASESESFGVSAVEAQSCEIPVIITDIPGLKEATSPGISSLVVPKASPSAIANRIEELYEDKVLRKSMGIAGRELVIRKYELKSCFEKIEKALKNNKCGLCL